MKSLIIFILMLFVVNVIAQTQISDAATKKTVSKENASVTKICCKQGTNSMSCKTKANCADKKCCENYKCCSTAKKCSNSKSSCANISCNKTCIASAGNKPCCDGVKNKCCKIKSDEKSE